LLGNSPQADISGKLNDIVIRTISNTRIAPVLDAIIQGFQNGDLFEAVRISKSSEIPLKEVFRLESV
jgi:hypothetical protein